MIINKQESINQDRRMFKTTFEPLENDSISNVGISSITEGFVRNRLCKGFTTTVEEASEEYKEECIRRKHLVEKIVVDDICEVAWIFGFRGD